MNLALYKRGIESRFVTLMYGSLEPDGRLTYCNAGHNPPLVVGKGGVRRLEVGGPIVGLFEHAVFEEETVTLVAGRHADRVQRRRVGGDVGRAATSTARSGSWPSSTATPALSPADMLQGDLRRRARVHEGRAAERRHHRAGAALRSVRVRRSY